jgi:hypothetical protein
VGNGDFSEGNGHFRTEHGLRTSGLRTKNREEWRFPSSRGW